MKIYTVRREQLVEWPLGDVFRLFEKPENLALITPPAMKFKIFTPGPIEKRNGTVVDYSVRILGIPIHWRMMITDYQRPYRFVDVQLNGPYTFWHHTHIFDECSRGTMIVDEVRYVMPFGIIGRLVHALFVRSRIQKIFDYRAGVVTRTFRAELESA